MSWGLGADGKLVGRERGLGGGDEEATAGGGKGAKRLGNWVAGWFAPLVSGRRRLRRFRAPNSTQTGKQASTLPRCLNGRTQDSTK